MVLQVMVARQVVFVRRMTRGTEVDEEGKKLLSVSQISRCGHKKGFGWHARAMNGQCVWRPSTLKGELQPPTNRKPSKPTGGLCCGAGSEGFGCPSVGVGESDEGTSALASDDPCWVGSC